MKILNTAAFWIICFLGIFIGALDFWSWGHISLSLFSLPIWVFYFIGLQVLLSLAIFIFSRSFWQHQEGDH